MNILFRHTFGSIARNPVQSLIVVISTALITACIFVCLCISSLFEQLTSLWSNNMYAGADLYVAVSGKTEKMTDYLQEHEDEVEAYYLAYENNVTLLTESETVRGYMIAVEDLDGFDALTGAEILSSADIDSDLPRAHISARLAEVADLSLGEVFTTKQGKEYVVTAIANNTARYFATGGAVFACELAYDLSPTRATVYLRDPDALRSEGVTVKDAWEAELKELFPANSAVNIDNGYYLEEAERSVRGSMRMMTIAAVVITALMGALLYASFSVIVRGRVNELVKFKAAGATPLQSAGILLFEAAIYALVGGLIGLGFGELLVDYIGVLLSENIVGGALVAESWKYPVAVLIGMACGVASCVIPALKMSALPIRRLLGGNERFTRPMRPVWAIVITLLVVAFGTAQFFVPRSALVPVAIIALLLLVVWLIAVMPVVLRGICSLTGSIARSGPASLASYAAPRNVAVSSTFTMLAALIMFISLGMGILDSVQYTSLAVSARYTADFIVTLSGVTDENVNAALQRALSVDGITDGAAVKSYVSIRLADENGVPIMQDVSANKTYVTFLAVDKGEDIRYFTLNYDPEIAARFDECENPIVITSYIAYKYDIEVGDTLKLLKNKAYSTETLVSTKIFTVVGIDTTVTSWDFAAVVRKDSLAFEGLDELIGEKVIYLNGDEGAFTTLRELLDDEHTTVFKREAYRSGEGTDRIDTSRLISVFSTIVYVIAAIGLVNLILITADERKREFDVLRLSGMTAKDAAVYIFTETAMLASGGVAAGLLLSLVANRATVAFSQLIDKYVSPEIFPTRIPVIAAVVCAVFVVVWSVAHVITFRRVSSPAYRKNSERFLRSD